MIFVSEKFAFIILCRELTVSSSIKTFKFSLYATSVFNTSSNMEDNNFDTMISKLARSPLRYSIIRAISCFVPRTIVSNPMLAESWLKDLIQILFNKKYLHCYRRQAEAADDCSVY